MQTLNVVNPTPSRVNDMRRGDFTQRNRACLTPWGQFRSIAVAADHVMTREGEFSLPFVVRAADSLEGASLEDVARRARKNISQNIYKRCQIGTETQNGQFRFL